MGTHKIYHSTNVNPHSPPPASGADVLARMKSQKQRDTKPEIELRSLLHGMGFRFRVNISPIKGMRSKADIVFPRLKVAIFVDGCFWHSCPEHKTLPKHNTEWWQKKLASNVKRDRDVSERLQEKGWTVVRIWEHEDTKEAAFRIVKVLKQRYGAFV